MNYAELHPHTQSSMRFHLETDKAAAWRSAQVLSDYLSSLLSGAGYVGPLAIAGGWVRDLALGRTPKDLDVFIDGGSLERMDQAEALASTMAAYLGEGFEVARTLPCYGNWAVDLEKVVKLEQGEGYPPLWLRKDMPVPSSIDLIVLSRAEMEKVGYRPQVVMSNGSRASFLAAVLARVDLRLNAIGATATGTDCSPQWSEDALNERLVVQAARLTAGPEVATRIMTRIDRQRQPEGKYAGWTLCLEQADGSLVEGPCLVP